MQNTAAMYEKFVDEYGSEDAVRKYTTGTAGYGITYLLRNEYARIYLEVVGSLRTSAARPLRLLEFGCGGGMNITRFFRFWNRRTSLWRAHMGRTSRLAWCKLRSRKPRSFSHRNLRRN